MAHPGYSQTGRQTPLRFPSDGHPIPPVSESECPRAHPRKKRQQSRPRYTPSCPRPTQRDRIANGVFVALRLQERNDRLRHRPLARDIELIRGAKLSQSLIQEVPELLSRVAADLLLAAASPSQKDRGGSRLGSADSLLVIMRHFGAPLGLLQNCLQCRADVGDRADT